MKNPFKVGLAGVAKVEEPELPGLFASIPTSIIDAMEVGAKIHMAIERKLRQAACGGEFRKRSIKQRTRLNQLRKQGRI